jgi:sortase A
MNRVVGGGIGLMLLIIGFGSLSHFNFKSNSSLSDIKVSEAQSDEHIEISEPKKSTSTVAIEKETKKQPTLAQEIKKEVKKVASQVVTVPKVSAEVSYPQTLIIPRMNVAAPVIAMGLEEGRMAVPNNYTEVGWYKYGTIPGNVGSAVMGAHVDDGGRTNGLFKNLKILTIGDDIYVTDTNGNKLHFRVTERKVYDRKTQVTDYVFARNDKARLNLITCHGTFLPRENTYNQRLVIFAELVSKE